MIYYRLAIICLIAASLACSVESQRTISTNDWHPDTEKLDKSAEHPHPMMDAAITLARDLKPFYQLLRDKQWDETYELHAKAFRKDVLKRDYLAEVKKAETIWELVNYDILSITFRNSIGATNFDEAMLICRFIERPGPSESYSAVFWHKEDGVWKCLSAGPCKLSIFRGKRAPIIDWR